MLWLFLCPFVFLSVNTYAQSYQVYVSGFPGSAYYYAQTYYITGSFGTLSNSTGSFIVSSVLSRADAMLRPTDTGGRGLGSQHLSSPGLRHLWMDVSHKAVEMHFGRLSAMTVLIASSVLTLATTDS